MATAEELLAQMEENPELYADNVGPVNDVIMINAETRTIELPESEKIFGVESDKASERKYFRCPKIVGDNTDLSTLNLFINFKNANNEGDIYHIDDVVVDGDYITFSWLLSKKVTAYKTDASKNQLLSFIFCAKNGESPDNEWNTTLCSNGIVLEGLEPGESIAEENPDIIQYILERLESAGTITPEQISQAVEEYMASNPFEETDPTVPAWAKDEAPDKNLNQEGKAADAKEVGDRLSKLSDDLNDYDERISAIEKGSGNGGSSLPDELKHAWKGHIEEVAYISTEHPYTDALHTLLGGSSDEPTPTKTLTSISASYSGGSVDVGTSLNSLKSNLVVKAIYSDGTQETITGYTLSGTIQEGNNDITVSYGGKTTTFNVVGNATVNPPADDVSNETKWTNGVVYTYEPVQNSYVETNGAITSYNDWGRTPYLYCEGASKLRITVRVESSTLSNMKYNAFYDANKSFISNFTFDLDNKSVGEYTDIDIPSNTCYFICSGKQTAWANVNIYGNYLTATPIE